MKIVYVAPIWGSSFEKGVINKIEYQIKALERLGNDVKLIAFYNISQEYNPAGKNHITKKIYSYYKAVKRLIKAVKNEKPEYIYIRDVMWLFNIYSKLSKIAPVFVEVQTDVLAEARNINKKRYLIEKLFKRSYLKNISGEICITDEICKIESKYNLKPSIFIGNGIDEEQIKFIPKIDENEFINIVLIGSPNIPWHGIDRLIKSYGEAPNREKIMLHIIGYDDNYEIRNSNIKFYGFIEEQEKIDRIFSMADIGIGSLAFYYNKINQAAPLKIRHYLAKGLPVIISHDDVDLMENLSFVMKVPNDNSNIDFLEVEKFYLNTRDIRRNGETVRFTLENLTWLKKMDRVCEFMNYTVKSIHVGDMK